MPTKQYTEQSKITEILGISSRLRFVLNTHYGTSLGDIICIYIDQENKKLDIQHTHRTLRFKAKGVEFVLQANPQGDGVVLNHDPALTQGIYEILADFG